MVTLTLAARMTRRHSSLTALLSHVVATLALSGRKRRARKHACDSGTRHPHQHDAQQQGCSNSGHGNHYSFLSCDVREHRVCDGGHSVACLGCHSGGSEVQRADHLIRNSSLMDSFACGCCWRLVSSLCTETRLSAQKLGHYWAKPGGTLKKGSSQTPTQAFPVEFLFPPGNHDGCHAIADHVHQGPEHAHETIDS